MNDDYGKRMTTALRAVLQMHSDASKLLIDLDKVLHGYQSLFDSVATMNLSYDVKSRKYMADGLFRHYVRKKDEAEVLAVNICFFDFNDPGFEEPLFVAAHLSYISAAADMQEKGKRAWDPWTAFVEWNKEKVFEKTIDLEGPLKNGTLESVTLIAAPLFSIQNQEKAKDLIKAVTPQVQTPRP